jgi:hypothetical protein
MRKMLHEQKAWIERTGFNYPTSPAHLGRGFEAMFTHDDLFAKFYRLLTRHTWEVVRAADGLTFLKGDNPAVIHGSTAKRTWQLMYPLTPVRCFIAGPALENGPARIVPHQRKLTDAQTLAVNGATCSFAENSVIGVVTANRIDPKPTIRANLPKTRTLDTVELPLWGLDTG